ncbi:hypothetical protein [Paremcibacter congregatus]|uniref:hypothetical protein n=1 Tax=Paremcibacter congregatus TaxID=2043170 RepID=UPI0030ECFE97|tara:strand:+ start:2892 stop:3350 length:459 start_codon:yes stop_codon:yes gene_type:complete
MKIFNFYIVILVSLGGCSPFLNGDKDLLVPVEGKDYALVINENYEAQRFILNLKALTDKNLCVSVDVWPNSIGQLSFATDRAYVLIGEEKYPYLQDRNFGYCVGICHIKVLSGKSIKGFVTFSEFDDEAFLEEKAKRNLIYQVQPSFCDDYS